MGSGAGEVPAEPSAASPREAGAAGHRPLLLQGREHPGQREGQSGAEASQAPVTSPTLPQPAPSRARTLEAGKRWARLAQARGSLRSSSCLGQQGPTMRSLAGQKLSRECCLGRAVDADAISKGQSGHPGLITCQHPSFHAPGTWRIPITAPRPSPRTATLASFH